VQKIAEKRAEPASGAGGPWFESSRPDHFLRASVDSDPAVVAQVAAAAAARAHLNPKPAAPYQPLAGSTPMQFTALDFLQKIGELTTPNNINLARLSASWATRRYFWAVHNPGRSLRDVLREYVATLAVDLEEKTPTRKKIPTKTNKLS
jgi:hypothetical protein